MAFYNIGERKKRPGVYLRIVNRGADAAIAAVSLPVTPTPTPDPEPPVETDGLMVSYDGSSVVTLTLPEGSTVSYADGTVTIAGLTEAVSYADGIVTIGG